MKVILNQSLITKQGLTPEEVSKIEELHHVKWKLIQRMRRSKKPETLRRLAAETTTVEFELQKAWHFVQSVDWHRSYTLPHCSCPVADNDERLGTPYRIISEDCILHGEKV